MSSPNCCRAVSVTKAHRSSFRGFSSYVFLPPFVSTQSRLSKALGKHALKRGTKNRQNNPSVGMLWLTLYQRSFCGWPKKMTSSSLVAVQLPPHVRTPGSWILELCRTFCLRLSAHQALPDSSCPSNCQINKVLCVSTIVYCVCVFIFAKPALSCVKYAGWSEIIVFAQCA